MSEISTTFLAISSAVIMLLSTAANHWLGIVWALVCIGVSMYDTFVQDPKILKMRRAVK